LGGKKKAMEDARQDYVVYAVRVLMVDRSISEQETTRVCRGNMVKDTSFSNTMLEDMETAGLSRDIAVYLHAMRSSYISVLVWSVYCSRHYFWIK
jgi:hypothetical protein